MSAIMAIGERRNNAELMADCHALGYLRDDDSVLDATYGLGRFWTIYRPTRLIASDLYAGGEDGIARWDFRHIPVAPRTFDVVVLDPPYKLNGTSTGKGPAASDVDYGVGASAPATWQERHALIRDGITECARVARRVLMVKCQDQVCSGQVRWQTREFAAHAEDQGFRLVDALHVQGHRKQPDGRRQVHARRDYSTLLVLERAS